MNRYNIKYWNIDHDKETTPNKLKQVEKKIGFEFPKDYKDFILHFKGKLYLNINNIMITDEFGEEEYSVVSLEDIDNLMKSWVFLKDYEELNGTFPIGSTLGNSYWAIDLNEEYFGTIYLVESDLTLNYVAASFTEFLEMIEYSNEIPIEFSAN